MVALYMVKITYVAKGKLELTDKQPKKRWGNGNKEHNPN